MKKKVEDFCDGCCYRRTCEHDLKKCCYMVHGTCIVNNHYIQNRDVIL